MTTQQLNSNLFTQAAVKRYISTKVLVEDLGVDINTIFNINPDTSITGKIKSSYADIKEIDTKIEDGTINPYCSSSIKKQEISA